MAIEYDGEGHFIPIDWAGRGEAWANESLYATQRRDEIKNNYCFENGIELLRISYFEIDDIETYGKANSVEKYFYEIKGEVNA